MYICTSLYMCVCFEYMKKNSEASNPSVADRERGSASRQSTRASGSAMISRVKSAACFNNNTRPQECEITKPHIRKCPQVNASRQGSFEAFLRPYGDLQILAVLG